MLRTYRAAVAWSVRRCNLWRFRSNHNTPTDAAKSTLAAFRANIASLFSWACQNAQPPFNFPLMGGIAIRRRDFYTVSGPMYKHGACHEFIMTVTMKIRCCGRVITICVYSPNVANRQVIISAIAGRALFVLDGGSSQPLAYQMINVLDGYYSLATMQIKDCRRRFRTRRGPNSDYHGVFALIC